MKLFKLEGHRLYISEEAYILKPFKTIWNRDKSKDKSNAIMELGYIYFMIDPRSDYQMYIDEDIRHQEIIQGEGMDKNWKPDKVVLEGIEFYKKFLPISALLLQDTRVAVDKLRTLLKEIDLMQVDDKGKPIYTLNVITSTIKQIPSLVKELDEAERALAKDLTQEENVRGARTKNMLEDD